MKPFYILLFIIGSVLTLFGTALIIDGAIEIYVVGDFLPPMRKSFLILSSSVTLIIGLLITLFSYGKLELFLHQTKSFYIVLLIIGIAITLLGIDMLWLEYSENKVVSFGGSQDVWMAEKRENIIYGTSLFIIGLLISLFSYGKLKELKKQPKQNQFRRNK